jgi:hypothetical protein
MNPFKKIEPTVAAIGYFVAVLILIFLAFDFDGDVRLVWLLLLLALTLPWSVVSLLFAWALMHGAGLGMFAVMYAAFASINAFIVRYLWSAFRRYYLNREAV